MIAVASLALQVVRLLAAGTEPFPPVDQDPDAVRDAACDIVRADPTDCAPPTSPELPSPGSTGSGGVGSAGAIVLFVVLAVLVLALIVLAIRYVRARDADDPDDEVVDGDEGGTVEESLDEAAGELADDDVADALEIEGAEWNGDRWRAAADLHHREGRARLALRCRYRGLVTDLGAAGWLHDAPGGTSGEHRRQVRLVAPDASGEFDAASDVFDAVWYGRAPVDDDSLARFVALEQSVLDRTGDRR